jgi:hypothetical protein
MSGGQPTAEDVERRGGLSNGLTGLQAADHVQPPYVSETQHLDAAQPASKSSGGGGPCLLLHGHRHPRFGSTTQDRTTKSARRDTDHRIGIPVQRDRSTDDAGVAAEAPLPR